MVGGGLIHTSELFLFIPMGNRILFFAPPLPRQ